MDTHLLPRAQHGHPGAVAGRRKLVHHLRELFSPGSQRLDREETASVTHLAVRARGVYDRRASACERVSWREREGPELTHTAAAETVEPPGERGAEQAERLARAGGRLEERVLALPRDGQSHETE